MDERILCENYICEGDNKIFESRFENYIQNGDIFINMKDRLICIDFIHENKRLFNKTFLWKAYVHYIIKNINTKNIEKCNFIFNVEKIDMFHLINLEWGILFKEIMNIEDFHFLSNWVISNDRSKWIECSIDLYKIILKKLFYLCIKNKYIEFLLNDFDFEYFGLDYSHFLFFNNFSHEQLNQLALKISKLSILDYTELGLQYKVSLFEVHYLLEILKHPNSSLSFQQIFHIVNIVVSYNIPESYVSICFMDYITQLVNEMNLLDNMNIWEYFFSIADWYMFASLCIKYYKKKFNGPSKVINEILITTSILLKYGKKDIPGCVISKNLLGNNEKFWIIEKIDILYNCYDMIFNEMYFKDTSSIDLIIHYWDDMNKINICPGDFSYFISPVRQVFYIYYRGLMYCKNNKLPEFKYYFIKLFENRNEFVSFNNNHICCVNSNINDSDDFLGTVKTFHCKTKPMLFPNSFTQVCQNVLPYIRENDLIHEYITTQFHFNANLNKIANILSNSTSDYFDLFQENECVICDEFNSYKLDCNHFMCKKCLIECLKNNISVCGYCRQKIFKYY